MIVECLNCNNPVESYESQIRKFCSRGCYHEYNNSSRDDKMKNGELGEQAIRRYLLKKYNNTCADCGWDKLNPHSGLPTVQVEHIDGDASNNKEENLKLLCPNCHSLTSTFGRLNSGKGKRKYVRRKI